MNGVSNWETHVLAAQLLIISSDDNSRGAAHWPDHRWNVEWLDKCTPTRLRTFIPETGIHPPGMTLPRIAWVRLNRLRTGVWRFRSCLHKWGMASFAACECGTEDQTIDHRCLPMSIPSTSTWSTAWRFWMMRQLIGWSRPVLRCSGLSRGLKELTQTIMMKQLVLACCRHSNLNQPGCVVFVLKKLV